MQAHLKHIHTFLNSKQLNQIHYSFGFLVVCLDKVLGFLILIHNLLYLRVQNRYIKNLPVECFIF